MQLARRRREAQGLSRERSHHCGAQQRFRCERQAIVGFAFADPAIKLVFLFARLEWRTSAALSFHQTGTELALSPNRHVFDWPVWPRIRQDAIPQRGLCFNYGRFNPCKMSRESCCHKNPLFVPMVTRLPTATSWSNYLPGFLTFSFVWSARVQINLYCEMYGFRGGNPTRSGSCNTDSAVHNAPSTHAWSKE